MPHLELIFLHSESADGCNARRVRTASTPDAEPATISKRQTAAEHLDRIEHEFGIEAAFDVGGLP